jgi:hypothetical protein
LVEKESLDRQFKSDALVTPEMAKGARVPEYDFSSSVFSKDPFSSNQAQALAPFKEKMSTVRPAYLDQIQTEPTYKVDLESFRQQSFGPPPT